MFDQRRGAQIGKDLSGGMDALAIKAMGKRKREWWRSRASPEKEPAASGAERRSAAQCSHSYA
jgi:hypothetical protein